MRMVRLRVAGCIALAVAAFGTIGPASADTMSGTDTAGDVLHLDTSEGFEQALPGTREPRRRDGDLTGYTVRHGAKRITAVLRFRELRRNQPVLQVVGRFRYPQRHQLEYNELVVTARKGDRRGTASSSQGRCDVAHRINYAKNRVRMSVSRRCFATPRWIQFNAMIIRTDRLRDPSYLYEDDIYAVFGDDELSVERYTGKVRPS